MIPGITASLVTASLHQSLYHWSLHSCIIPVSLVTASLHHPCITGHCIIGSLHHFITPASLQQRYHHPRLSGVHGSWPHLQPSWQRFFSWLPVCTTIHRPHCILLATCSEATLLGGNFPRVSMREAHVCSPRPHIRLEGDTQKSVLWMQKHSSHLKGGKNRFYSESNMSDYSSGAQVQNPLKHHSRMWRQFCEVFMIIKN